MEGGGGGGQVGGGGGHWSKMHRKGESPKVCRIFYSVQGVSYP